MRTRQLALITVAIVAACGGDAAPSTTVAPTTTTSTTSTTSTTTTTTTTVPATTTTLPPETTVTTFPTGFASPLNGLAAEDTLKLDRSVIAVKIDNHPEARPQSGLLDADAVIELLVEGGFSRFIALFHDNEADLVGPIRSLRPTDSTVVLPTGAPLFMSGGQVWIQELTVARGQRILGESAGMFRSPLKTAPHNLYGRTETLRARADARGATSNPAAALLPIDEWPYPEDEASEIELRWSDNNVVTWRYFPDKRTYGRWTNNARHHVQDADREQTQIEAEVLVVLEAALYTAFPPADGTPVPATDTVGSGRAWVFARGRVWQGTWHRDDIDDPFELRSQDGTAASVPAGFPWISVFPAGRVITIDE